MNSLRETLQESADDLSGTFLHDREARTIFRRLMNNAADTAESVAYKILTENRMEMKIVKSSQIHSVGHDPATNTLAIRFWGKKLPSGEREAGGLYHYPNFTEAKFKEFCECESKGKFFGTMIKNAKDKDGNALHPHQKIEDVPKEK